MSTARVAVFGEGAHELGRRLREPIQANDPAALPRLVHRVCGASADVEFLCIPWVEAKKIHGKAVNDFARRAKGAILRAKLENCQAAVILIDRDREPDKQRIGALRQAQNEMAADPFPPCAVGTAVEAFDAWMIGDGTAIGKGGRKSRHLSPPARGARRQAGQRATPEGQGYRDLRLRGRAQ